MPAATRQRAWSPLVTFLAWTLAGAPVSAVVAPPRPVHTPAASVGESAGAELADENGPVPQAGGERLPPGLLYGLSTGGPGENEFLSDGTLANDPSRLGKAQARKSLCLRGRGFLVALRVAFADRRGRVERAAHDSLLFGADRSLRRYFWEASEGELEVTGSVLPRDGSWFTLHWPMASYGSDTGPNNSDPTCRDRGVFSPMDFVRAAVECADPAVDFSLYDGNGDGSVDYLLIIHAGDDQATSQRPEDLWSRHLVLDDPLVTDGVRIESAMIVAETSPLGTLCHEFAHELGAPDLYESPSRSSLCLMGTGCWNGDPPGTEPAMLSAYLRWDIDGDPSNGKEGWLTPQLIAPEGEWQLTAHPLLLHLPGGDFLLEHRGPRWPFRIPGGEELVVYRVGSEGWDVLCEVPIGRTPRPSSLQLPGLDTPIRIEAGGEKGALLSFVDGSEGAPAGLNPERPALMIHPNPFHTFTSILLTLRETAAVEVFDLRGRKVARLSPGPRGVTWDGRDSEGKPLPPGLYLIRCQIDDTVLHATVTLLR